MSGVSALINEIRNAHYSNTSQEDAPKPAKSQPAKTPSKDQTEKRERKTRRRRSITDVEVSNPSMYTVTIIGGLAIPGYPLNPGEKLAIAKLVPVTVQA